MEEHFALSYQYVQQMYWRDPVKMNTRSNPESRRAIHGLLLSFIEYFIQWRTQKRQEHRGNRMKGSTRSMQNSGHPHNASAKLITHATIRISQNASYRKKKKQKKQNGQNMSDICQVMRGRDEK